MLRELLDFLLPPTCVVCGGLGGSVCQECFDALPWLSEPICDRCGAPMGREICRPDGPLARGVSRCPRCAGRRIGFRRARASLAYRAGAVEVVHAIKYGGVKAAARPLAARAAAQWADRELSARPSPHTAGGGTPDVRRGAFFDVDAVTFVPLVRRREADRGYNQAEILARALADALTEDLDRALPVRSWLAQRRATADQVRLDASSRRANVTAAYDLRAGLPQAGRRILLVDDVYTTGATAEVCAALLRQAGWGEVRVWTLARVIRGGALTQQVARPYAGLTVRPSAATARAIDPLCASSSLRTPSLSTDTDSDCTRGQGRGHRDTR